MHACMHAVSQGLMCRVQGACLPLVQRLHVGHIGLQLRAALLALAQQLGAAAQPLQRLRATSGARCQLSNTPTPTHTSHPKSLCTLTYSPLSLATQLAGGQHRG
jgi:hypothetical protein